MGIIYKEIYNKLINGIYDFSVNEITDLALKSFNGELFNIIKEHYQSITFDYFGSERKIDIKNL